MENFLLARSGRRTPTSAGMGRRNGLGTRVAPRAESAACPSSASAIFTPVVLDDHVAENLESGSPSPTAEWRSGQRHAGMHSCARLGGRLCWGAYMRLAECGNARLQKAGHFLVCSTVYKSVAKTSNPLETPNASHPSNAASAGRAFGISHLR